MRFLNFSFVNLLILNFCHEISYCVPRSHHDMAVSKKDSDEKQKENRFSCDQQIFYDDNIDVDNFFSMDKKNHKKISEDFVEIDEENYNRNLKMAKFIDEKQNFRIQDPTDYKIDSAKLAFSAVLDTFNLCSKICPAVALKYNCRQTQNFESISKVTIESLNIFGEKTNNEIENIFKENFICCFLLYSDKKKADSVDFYRMITANLIQIKEWSWAKKNY